MDLRYVYNDQPVAEGERSVLYKGNKLYVRTGFLGEDFTDPDNLKMTYRLREVYIKTVTPPPPTNHPPVGENFATNLVVDPKK